MESTIKEGSRYQALYEEGKRVAVDIIRDDSVDAFVEVMAALTRFNEQHCSPPKLVGDIYELAHRCIKEASKSLGDERAISKAVLGRLSKHFEIYEQVRGTHWSGRRIIIDAIVKPRDDSEWKTKSPSLGIEFKNFRGFRRSFDMKDYTRWWAQCHDYAETDFDGHGYVFVFSYNGFSHYRTRLKDSTSAALAVRFWGQLGVGELEPTRDTYRNRDNLVFTLQSHKIWSELNGPCGGAKHWSMNRKFGSR
jgi:hypothetical protein